DAPGNQEGDATANASANPRAREMAEARRNRLLCIPRGADQQSCTAHIQASRHRSLAPLAPTSEPEGSDDLEQDQKLADDFLPQARILHPWPHARFAVKHPRWEPSALIGLGSVRGALSNERPYRDLSVLAERRPALAYAVMAPFI